MNNGFNRFSNPLFNNVVKMLNVPVQKMFGMSAPQEIFYTIKDGNWNDPTIWETVSGRRGKLPTAIDDVYVRNIVTVNTNTTINSLYVNGRLTINSSFTLSLNNKFVGAANSQLINAGTLSFLTQPAAENSMTAGVADFTTNVNTVQFNGNYSARISSYFNTFHNLTIGGTGIKTTSVNTTTNAAVTCTSNGSLTLGGNLIVGGNLSIGSLSLVGTLECSTFNLTVTGTTTVGVNSSTLSKNGAGNILFIGALIGSDTGTGGSILNLTGNPDVEFRGGATIMFYITGFMNTGTGTWRFTTNNQTLFPVGVYNLNCTIIISGITLTIAHNGGQGFVLNSTIDGIDSSSILNLNGRLFLANSTQVLPMFTNGTFNHMAAATSVLGFIFNGNYTLPYTTFNGLGIGGTGIKTLGGNTTLSSFSSVNSGNATLEMASFDFNNSGTTSISAGPLLLSKTGLGTITFGGLVNIIAANVFGGFNFTGNPTIEFKNGFTNGGAEIVSFNLGSGPISFTTNNQTFSHPFRTTTINGTMTIGNGITLTIDNSNAGGTTFIINGVVNGSNGTSTLRMDVNNVTVYNNTTQPMVTGILDTSTNANTWRYNLAGNQDVKGGTYRTLNFGGSGVKTLQGNVTVPTAGYSVTGTATVNLNGFTLTLT